MLHLNELLRNSCEIALLTINGFLYLYVYLEFVNQEPIEYEIGEMQPYDPTKL
jgi:hypothetical protein